MGINAVERGWGEGNGCDEVRGEECLLTWGLTREETRSAALQRGRGHLSTPHPSGHFPQAVKQFVTTCRTDPEHTKGKWACITKLAEGITSQMQPQCRKLKTELKRLFP